MCYDDKPPKEFRAYLNCGHVVCQDCWLDVVKDGCKEGLKCLDMFCPMGKKACGVAITVKKSIVKVDKNGNSDVSNGQAAAAAGNGQVANGHTVLLASNGTDLRQRKL